MYVTHQSIYVNTEFLKRQCTIIRRQWVSELSACRRHALAAINRKCAQKIN